MADQESHPSRAPSRAEQRLAAVAKLKRAASLPRMKDGRRPPMHVEAVSEGEKPQTDDDKIDSEEEKQKFESEDEKQRVEVVQVQIAVESETEQTVDTTEDGERPPELDSDHPLSSMAETPADSGLDVEQPDTELEERSMSPSTTKKRRSRSRSRSRGSKDLKGKLWPPPSPMPQLTGDSSQDETPPLPSPMTPPMVPLLVSPMPNFAFLQQSRFLRSPTPLLQDMTSFLPGPSPPTPLPTLEDLQKGLMRSNSVGTAAAGRRLAMHKLTGGTESYDPSPSPTPPPFLSKLGRNNTVAGGERIAARQNLLSRLGTRVTREADAEAASGSEDRVVASPTPRRRRRRSRRGSATINANAAVSDSEFPSTDANTPAVPSLPLPASRDQSTELRAKSTTPNLGSSSRTHSSERVSTKSPFVPSIAQPKEEHERPERHRRRSVLIEDQDDEDQNDSPSLPPQRYPTLPGTPQRTFQTIDALRTHASNTPSNGSSSDSAPASAVGVPVFLSQRAPSRNEPFPTGPFTTPLKERTLSDEDEEQVIYPATTARPRTPYGNALEILDREISWIASPVPEIRMPIDDDEDDSEIDGEAEMRSHIVQDIGYGGPDDMLAFANSLNRTSLEVYDDMSPRASTSSKSILVELEVLPEHGAADISPSPSPALSSPPSVVRVEELVSPLSYPQRLSVASRIQSSGDRSPIGTESEWEGYTNGDLKRAETPSSSAWEKVKNTLTLTRAGSSSGRRSRTNSIVTRRDNTDSSISHESGGSLMIGKMDVQPSIQAQAPPLMQSPSASASIQSLAPLTPTRVNASPIPPASSADFFKYQNAKLFPFPGIVMLENGRRARAFPTPSSPDFTIPVTDEFQAPSMTYSLSSSSSQTADPAGDRKVSHQNSDKRLYAKYGAEPISPKPSVQEYIDLSPTSQQNGGGYNLKLPMTLPGVKQWLSKNSKKRAALQTQNNTGSLSLSPLSVIDSSGPTTGKRPSLSDIVAKRPNELGNDWDEMPVTPDSNKAIGNGTSSNATRIVNAYDSDRTSQGQPTVVLGSMPSQEMRPKVPNDPSPPCRVAIASPDPSSLSDYPAPTPSGSSATSSQSSLNGQQGSLVLERLEENLARGSRSPMWSAAVDDPPRKLVLSSPVLQVVNPNTVKDRFLFLFTDILVIAKPVTPNPHDSLSDPYKLNLPDKKYVVKNVVQLQKLRFCADRVEVIKTASLGPRNPMIRSFISDFSVDPDRAAANLFIKARIEMDPSLLGQLLSKTLDLDRSRLGEYLSKRSSRAALKSYLDSFGFVGLRVDVALRVFLHSINMSQYTHSYGALEYLLDSFASRWYEANAKFVAYDKDMAVQLVWALAQLNDRLHGFIADEPGATDQILRTVTTREFQDAFRRFDPRYLVSDELLQELYRSIFHERLCQACPSMISSSQEVPVTIKRPLPCRLTYKAQSEPIVFRLSQPDPLFTIELYGQDLIFDPPILHFARSSEASFRVTGTSLGSKTMTMCRSGPNAIKYSGLPLSHSIVVERAFMKNTFQIAFVNPTGVKRRYMFSVDDTIIRNEWVTCLRRQIDNSNATAAALKSAGSFASSKFHRAAQTIAFDVLREKLVDSRTSGHGLRVGGSSQDIGDGSTLSLRTRSSTPFSITPIHARSKSRSKVYRLEGAGNDELKLNRLQNNSGGSNDSSNINLAEQRPDGTLWTSRDLEIYCQQNSSISLVLSFLQVGAPELAAS